METAGFWHFWKKPEMGSSPTTGTNDALHWERRRLAGVPEPPSHPTRRRDAGAPKVQMRVGGETLSHNVFAGNFYCWHYGPFA